MLAKRTINDIHFELRRDVGETSSSGIVEPGVFVSNGCEIGCYVCRLPARDREIIGKSTRGRCESRRWLEKCPSHGRDAI
jgi:hypothetical protein